MGSDRGNPGVCEEEERDPEDTGVSRAFGRSGPGVSGDPCCRDERKGFGLCFFDIDALRSGNPVRNVCFAASGGYPGAVSDRRGDGPGGGFCKGVSGGAGCL